MENSETRSRNFALIIIGAIAVSGATRISVAATFDVDVSVGPGSVTGQIVTDGVIGTVLPMNVLDWNLTVNDGSTSLILLGPLSGANSGFDGDAGLLETATQLLFDFGASTLHYGEFCLPTCSLGWSYVSFGHGIGEHLVSTNDQIIAGDKLTGIGIIGELASAPLPSAVWLFGTALGGMGLAQRRFVWCS